MKKFSFKSFAAGLIVGLAGVITVTAAGMITSAQFRETKVTFNHGAITPELKNPLVGIINDTEADMKLYMPLREVLETLQYTVTWDEETDTVDIANLHSDGTWDYSNPEPNTVVKRASIAVGYQTYTLGTEIVRGGNKWVHVWSSTEGFEISDKITESTEDGETVQTQEIEMKVPHSVELNSSHLFVFEEVTANGNKTGKRIIYEARIMIPGESEN
jgi:hypothetical protein